MPTPTKRNEAFIIKIFQQMSLNGKLSSVDIPSNHVSYEPLLPLKRTKSLFEMLS